jgi:hypothetical protein
MDMANVLILKMFMFAWGLQLALFHPIKGRNKDNILELIRLGFNSWPWVPIKRRGFFVYKLYECIFMPRMEATSGIGI